MTSEAKFAMVVSGSPKLEPEGDSADFSNRLRSRRVENQKLIYSLDLNLQSKGARIPFSHARKNSSK